MFVIFNSLSQDEMMVMGNAGYLAEPVLPSSCAGCAAKLSPCSGLRVSWRAPRHPGHRAQMLLLFHATLPGWDPHLPPPSFQSADGDHVPEEATVLPAWVPGWPWEVAEIHLPWFLREIFCYWVQARSTCHMTGQWIPETRCWGQGIWLYPESWLTKKRAD